MSSDEDYYPPNESPSDRRRRSKRITRYSGRKTKPANLIKSYVKPEKRFTTTRKNEKSPPIVKDIIEATEEPDSGTFNGEALSPAELHQLYVKFQKDRHFRCISSTPSSPRPKSRTMNGKLDTKRKKHTKEVTATVNSQRASMENTIEEGGTLPHETDPLSVTLLNPLPNASGSTLHISPDKSSSIPLFPSDLYKNWKEPTLCQNFLSSGTFREKNGIDLSSNRNTISSFIPPKQYQPLLVTNSYKQVFNKPNLNSAWKSFDHGNEPLNPQNQANSCGLYYPGNSLYMGYNENGMSMQINRANRENIGNPYEICPKPSSTQIYQYNGCSDFGQAENAPGHFQSRPMNQGTSAYVLQTNSHHRNLPNSWVGTTVNNISSSFPNTGVPTNDLPDSRNSPKYHSPDLRDYNSELSLNQAISSSGFGANENSTNGLNSNPNPHYMSLMSCNGLQVFPNLCSTTNELSCPSDLLNLPVSPGQPSMLINEPRNIDTQPTHWLQHNLFHRGAFANIGNQVSSTITPHLTNTVPVTTTTTATKLNEATEVASINGNDTDDSTLFIDDISKDVDICQMVSSFSSYDDDLDYENYVDDNIPYNENSVSTTMNLNHETHSDMVTTVKTEVRSLCDSSNHPQYNNHATLNNQSSIFYDLGTTKVLEMSPDPLIVQDSSIF